MHENFVVVFYTTGAGKLEVDIEAIQEQLMHLYPNYMVDVQHG